MIVFIRAFAYHPGGWFLRALMAKSRRQSRDIFLAISPDDLVKRRTPGCKGGVCYEMF